MSVLSQQYATRLRAPFVVDKYGNETTVRDWANASRLLVARVSVQPDGSAEESGDRSSVVTGWRLITRKGHDVDVLPGDRFEYDGMTLDVDGEVGRFHLAGRVHHVEIRLKRVSG